MLEGLLLSTVNGGKFSDAGSGKLSLSEDDPNLLSFQEFSSFFLGQLPQQLDLEAAALLPERNGQNLPFARADGTSLPLQTIESILNRLSDPAQAKQLGFTDGQLAAIKDLLNESLKSIDSAKTGQTLNDLIARKTANGNSGDLIHKAKDSIDLPTFKEAIMEIVLSDKGQKNRIENLLGSVNHGQQATNATQLNFSNHALNSNSLVSPLQSQLLPAEHQTKPANYVPSVTVDTQIGRPQWAEAFNSRVLLLSQDQIPSAQIKLNPAELGPVEIRLSMNKDQTHIHFIAQHSEVRDAIEEAFPRLRELMGQSGVNLGDVNVSQHSASYQSPVFDNEQFINGEQNSFEQSVDEQDHRAVAVSVQKGLVDEIV